MASSRSKHKGNRNSNQLQRAGGGNTPIIQQTSNSSGSLSSNGADQHSASPPTLSNNKATHPRRNNTKYNGNLKLAPTTNSRSVPTGGNHNRTDPVQPTSLWMAPDGSLVENVPPHARSGGVACREIIILAVILVCCFFVSMIMGMLMAGVNVSLQVQESDDNTIKIIPAHGWEPQYLSSLIQPSTITTITTTIPPTTTTQLATTEGENIVLYADGTVLNTSNSGKDSNSWTTTTTSSSSSEYDDDRSVVHQLVRPPVMASLDHWVRSKPIVCKDGYTVGYDSWKALKDAVQDVNRYSALRYKLWHDYFVKVLQSQQASGTECTLATPNCNVPHVFEDNNLYYEEEIIMTICPGATLRKVSGDAIYVNTESMVFECANNCILQASNGGSHFSFGPEAKNVRIRGLTFRHATTSSLLFHHNGADVSLEDCHFVKNRSQYPRRGALADVNSTSSVAFFRCYVTKTWGRRLELLPSLSIRSGS